ncbi:MAG: OmpA family protein [Nitrospirota bacterium]|nr:OmpA family protein [Nitrospirota bacterium]MDH4359552.1 OmpA family protein [Nitrospirota bacterium]
MAGSQQPSSSSPRFSVKESKGFSHLRQLLLAPEQHELDRLKTRLDQFSLHPKDVGRVLPDAIRLRAQQDTRLLASLIPVTQEALALSIKQSPQLISDSIAPILGSAIRKAIAHAMRGLMQSLNQTLECSMSWRGLQWRWEAFRTGKSFAEVVLLHTLRFRVEQVFLIHKKTGLLLNHVVAEGVSGQGEEVISGMLTAIQDFVCDSFGQSQDEGLESIRIGDLTVWIEQGWGAILAGVIRGAPPMELREVFQETLETIHAQFSELLQAFQGDASSFQETRLQLEDCLQAQFEQKSRGLPWAFWIVLGLLMLGLGMWAFQAHADQQRWAYLLERLDQEPGLVMTSIQEEGTPTIYGLRDPLAINPDQILSDIGYSSQQVVFRLKPFMDLTPEFVQKRAMIQLRPPSSVVGNLEGTTLILKGEAPHSWIQQAHLLGPLLPGVTHIETRQLVDTDLKQFETLKAELESKTITFEVGNSDISLDQRSTIRDIDQTIQALDQTATILGIFPRIQIQGFTSPDGGKEVNQSLSALRAKAVLNELANGSFQAINLRTVGVGSDRLPALSSTGKAVSQERRVAFRVILPPPASVPKSRR